MSPDSDVAQYAREIVKRCKYGDPFCPCQDGYLCHYAGKNPMAPPVKYVWEDVELAQLELPLEEIDGTA